VKNHSNSFPASDNTVFLTSICTDAKLQTLCEALFVICHHQTSLKFGDWVLRQLDFTKCLPKKIL